MRAPVIRERTFTFSLFGLRISAPATRLGARVFITAVILALTTMVALAVIAGAAGFPMLRALIP